MCLVVIWGGGSWSKELSCWYNEGNTGSDLVGVTTDVTKISYLKNIWTAVQQGLFPSNFEHLEKTENQGEII